MFTIPPELYELYTIRCQGHSVCSICRRGIDGPVELIMAITSGPCTVAHFWCFYPLGADRFSLPLIENDFRLLTLLAPEEAVFFWAKKMEI